MAPPHTARRESALSKKKRALRPRPNVLPIVPRPPSPPSMAQYQATYPSTLSHNVSLRAGLSVLPLPPELRESIYGYVSAADRGRAPYLSLTGVNKATRDEALACYFRHNGLIIVDARVRGLLDLAYNFDVTILNKYGPHVCAFAQALQHSMVIQIIAPRAGNQNTPLPHDLFIISVDDWAVFCEALAWSLHSGSRTRSVQAYLRDDNGDSQVVLNRNQTCNTGRARIDVHLLSPYYKPLTLQLEQTFLQPLRQCREGGMVVYINGNTHTLLDTMSYLKYRDGMGPGRIDLDAMAWTTLQGVRKFKDLIDRLFREGGHDCVMEGVPLVCAAFTDGLLCHLPNNFYGTRLTEPLARAVIILLDCYAMAVTSALKLSQISNLWPLLQTQVTRLFVLYGRLPNANALGLMSWIAIIVNHPVHLELYRVMIVLQVMRIGVNAATTTQHKISRLNEQHNLMRDVASISGTQQAAVDWGGISAIWNNPITRSSYAAGTLSAGAILSFFSPSQLGDDVLINTPAAYRYTVPPEVYGWNIKL